MLNTTFATEEINKLASSSGRVEIKRSARSIPERDKVSITVGSPTTVMDPSCCSTDLHLVSEGSINVTSEPASINQVANRNPVPVAPTIMQYKKTSDSIRYLD